jgi:RNA-directed DNA polymerase
MGSTPKLSTISTKQARIAELAKQMPGVAIRTLAHHMDLDWLREAHRRTRKDGATGVDGETAEEFATELDSRLAALVDRAKSGTYRAPPVRRVEIPKASGGTRPIGIPTYEDKVLQRGVHMLLEPLYEQEFYDFSYGFRPGRSAHDALDALREALWKMGGGWVVDADVSKFFDTLDHARLQELLSQRVTDGVVKRLVGKWLNAGVLDGGVVSRSPLGTPQGGVISPLLANIYLHEALDKWWVRDVLPRLRGRAILIRYADDFVMAFSDHADALRVMKVLPERLARFGLTLHAEKTRLIDFQSPAWRGEDPGTFDFLGFTFYWARSRRGSWVLKRKTAKSRLTRSLRALKEWMRAMRHEPLARQAEELARKMTGHFNYFGTRGNSAEIGRFAHWATELWRKALARRSQRGMTWARFRRILARYPLPAPRLAPRYRDAGAANL